MRKFYCSIGSSSEWSSIHSFHCSCLGDALSSWELAITTLPFHVIMYLQYTQSTRSYQYKCTQIIGTNPVHCITCFIQHVFCHDNQSVFGWDTEGVSTLQTIALAALALHYIHPHRHVIWLCMYTSCSCTELVTAQEQNAWKNARICRKKERLCFSSDPRHCEVALLSG